jgi:DnaJ-class molecular chaperone
MTHYWKKYCKSCDGDGFILKLECNMPIHECCNACTEKETCEDCAGTGEILVEMDDLSEEQFQLMNLGFERCDANPHIFELDCEDSLIKAKFNDKSISLQIDQIYCVDVSVLDIVERVKALYFGVTGEELTTKN